MGRINWKRVFLGGLVWWAVFHLLGVAARLLYLAEEVTAAWKALGLHFSLTPGFAVFWLVLTYGGGVISIWLYAAIQPRYGPGPTTALRAGLTAWFGSFVYVMFLGWAGVFPCALWP